MDLLLEVMYSDYSAPELVLESADVVFQRFMPQVLQARRAAEAVAQEEGEGQLVPEFLEQLATKVSIIGTEYDARQKKSAVAGAGASEQGQAAPVNNPAGGKASRKKGKKGRHAHNSVSTRTKLQEELMRIATKVASANSTGGT